MSVLIWNGISLAGNRTEISKLKQFIEGPYDPFGKSMLIDFRKIIQMPAKLKVKSPLSEEVITWCENNWQCPSNVLFSKYVGYNKIFFETRNGIALHLLKELSKLSPRMTIYYFWDYDYSDYCCIIQNGKLIKANFKSDDDFDYIFEEDFESDFFNKFYSTSGFELEYVPGEDPDIQENYEIGYNLNEEPDIDPYNISDVNGEILKIINSK